MYVIIIYNLQVSSQNQKRWNLVSDTIKVKLNKNLLEMDWENDLNALTAEDVWTLFSMTKINCH